MTKRHESVPILGVPEMDRDHLAIEALFVSTAQTADDDLPDLLDRIAQKLEDHFRREEILIAAGHVPLSECHKAQHRMILHEVAAVQKIAPGAETRALRRLMETVLRQMINA